MSLQIGMYKGFVNEPDSNNCFINTILQVLFHQPLFRKSIREATILHIQRDELGNGECSCILCSLKFIEQELRNPGESLSSKPIRNALLSMNHVQMYEMGDAIEAFEDIAELLHLETIDHSALCDSDDCIAHSLFGIVHTITSSCPLCGKVQERKECLWHQPLIISQLLKEKNLSKDMTQIINHQLSLNKDFITCDHCTKQGITSKVPVEDFITQYPPLLAVSCVFQTATPPFDTMINLFHLLISPSCSSYSLHSFVCYRHYHYISICLEGNLDTEDSFWVEYNDNQRTIFISTDSMISHCLQTQALPVLLFFSTNRYDSFDFHSSAPDLDDQIVNTVELDQSCCGDEDSFFSFASSIANTVKNFFKPSSQDDSFSVRCPFCSQSSIIHSDDLVCPECHNPLP